MKQIKDWWSQLSPKHRKTTMSMGILALLLIVLYLFISAGPEQQKKNKNVVKLEKNVLTGTDTKILGLDAMGAKQKEFEKTNKKLQKQLDLAKKERKKLEEIINSKLGKMTEAITDIQRQTDEELGYIKQEQKDTLLSLKDEVSRSSSDLSRELEQRVKTLQSEQSGTLDSEEARRSNLFDDGQMVAPSGKAKAPGSNGASMDVRVRTYGEEKPQITNDTQNDETVYIPAGSIIAGVMVTGVDAPTNLQSKRDPMPALIRIKHDAILPNRFKADVKECFMVLGTRGDLSTERAFMRAETLSCIRNDGGVIEAVVDGYIVGEDGKAGMRGRLVHRNGSLIAKSMAAGFLSALGQMYKPRRVRNLNTSPGSTTLYQQPDPLDALETGVYGGASEAMDRLADYYVELAEEIRPFIEIDAGRRVEAILLKGVKLQLLTV